MNDSGVLLGEKTSASINRRFIDLFIKVLEHNGYTVEDCSSEDVNLLSITEIGKGYVVVVNTSSEVSKTERPIAKIELRAIAAGDGFHEIEVCAKEAVTKLRHDLVELVSIDLSIANVVEVDIDNLPRTR